MWLEHVCALQPSSPGTGIDKNENKKVGAIRRGIELNVQLHHMKNIESTPLPGYQNEQTINIQSPLRHYFIKYKYEVTNTRINQGNVNFLLGRSRQKLSPRSNHYSSLGTSKDRGSL